MTAWFGRCLVAAGISFVAIMRFFEMATGPGLIEVTLWLWGPLVAIGAGFVVARRIAEQL